MLLDGTRRSFNDMNKRLIALLLAPIVLICAISSPASAADPEPEENVDELGESPVDPEVPDAPTEVPDAPAEPEPDVLPEVKPDPWGVHFDWLTVPVGGYSVSFPIFVDRDFYDPKGDLGDIPGGEERR